MTNERRGHRFQHTRMHVTWSRPQQHTGRRGKLTSSFHRQLSSHQLSFCKTGLRYHGQEKGKRVEEHRPEEEGAVGGCRRHPLVFLLQKSGLWFRAQSSARRRETRNMIRRMEERDVVRAGEVIVAAFSDVCTRHAFPPPFPVSEVGVGIARGYLHLEPQECFVAEEGGRVVGSGFLHLRGATAGIGPITVDPISQSKGVGKELMMTVLRAGRHCPSLRLV